jgi:LEA14-like dessication related protein
VDVAGASFRLGESLRVHVVAYNPNRFGVQVSDMEYTLSAGAVRIGAGRLAEKVTIGARDTVRVDLPLGLERMALLRALPQALQESLEFRVDGVCRLSAPFLRRRVEFHTADTIGLRQKLAELLERGE